MTKNPLTTINAYLFFFGFVCGLFCLPCLFVRKFVAVSAVLVWWGWLWGAAFGVFAEVAVLCTEGRCTCVYSAVIVLMLFETTHLLSHLDNKYVVKEMVALVLHA